MLKDEAIHFTLSIVAGLVIYLISGNALAIPAALVSGFFIDVDHLFDYLLYKNFRQLDAKEFFSGSFFDKSGKVILPLHAYEYGIILIVLGLIFPHSNWLFLPLGLSLIFHLVYDTISNRPSWPTYFILFRIAKNFDHPAFDFKCGNK